MNVDDDVGDKFFLPLNLKHISVTWFSFGELNNFVSQKLQKTIMEAGHKKIYFRKHALPQHNTH